MSSSASKQELIAAVSDAVQRFQEATDAIDAAAAQALGLGATDLRCLGVVHRHGSVSAGEIARATGLTRGATTTALDRVERSGYARRKDDPNDRRGVLVEMTEAGLRASAALYGPLAQEGGAKLSRYTVAELQLVLHFLEEGRALQERHAQRIRAQGTAG